MPDEEKEDTAEPTKTQTETDTDTDSDADTDTDSDADTDSDTDVDTGTVDTNLFLETFSYELGTELSAEIWKTYSTCEGQFVVSSEMIDAGYSGYSGLVTGENCNGVELDVPTLGDDDLLTLSYYIKVLDTTTVDWMAAVHFMSDDTAGSETGAVVGFFLDDGIIKPIMKAYVDGSSQANTTAGEVETARGYFTVEVSKADDNNGYIYSSRVLIDGSDLKISDGHRFMEPPSIVRLQCAGECYIDTVSVTLTQ